MITMTSEEFTRLHPEHGHHGVGFEFNQGAANRLVDAFAKALLAEDQATHVEQICALLSAATGVLISIGCDKCTKASLRSFLEDLPDCVRRGVEQMKLLTDAN